MPFITQGKTNLKYILIVVVLAIIVGGGILISRYNYWWGLERPPAPPPEPVTIEGKLVKEDYISAVVWVIETKDGKKYVPEGIEFDELVKLGEGTELKIKGYITKTTITIPEAGELTRKTKNAINVVNYEILTKDEIANCLELNEEQCRAQSSCLPLGNAINTYITGGGEIETFLFDKCVDKAPEYSKCKEVVKMTQMRGGTLYSKECRCCCGEGPYCKEKLYPEK